MVKAPRVRHSKTEREPVTIDLGPDAVSRVVETDLRDDSVSSDMSDAGETQAGPSATPGENPAAEATFSDTMAGSNDSQPAHDSERETRQAPFPTDSAPPAARRLPLAAGLAGGVIALAAAAGLQFAGLLPAGGGGDGGASVAALQSEVAALRQEMAGLKENGGTAGVEALKAAIDDSTARVEGMTALVDQLKTDVVALQSAVQNGGAGDAAAVQALDAKIKAIEAAVAALDMGSGAASDAAITALSDKLATIETAVGAVASAASANDGRLAALEQTVGELSKQLEGQGEQPKVALAIAAAALKAAIDRGGTFSAEVETFAAIAPDSPDLPALRELAAKGVASRAEILADVSAAADMIIGAEVTLSEDAGFFERLWGSAASLVSVRPIGAVEGEGVPQIVARMEAALKDGDLARALLEYDSLPAAPKAAGAAFADKIRTRIAVEELVDKALAGALKAA